MKFHEVSFHTSFCLHFHIELFEKDIHPCTRQLWISLRSRAYTEQIAPAWHSAIIRALDFASEPGSQT
jgi:hypothetical protein